MRIADRIVGRDRERSQLQLGIGPGDDGLRLAMLTGPSGLGKTTLLTDAVEVAGARGFRVAVGQGRAAALSTPFAPWAEALPEFAALVEGSGYEAHRDIDQLGIALVAMLEKITAETPLLLAFDDAQALDESSLALLPYAAGVAEHLNLTFMLVEQTDAIDVSSSYRAFADGLLSRRVVHHLALGPMSDESIGELIRAVLGLDDEAEVPTEVVLRAEGNPWFAKELAEAHQRGDSELPVNISAAATARLHRLDEKSQDVVFAVALCPEGAQIGWLEVIADQKPREFVRTMEAIMASGLVREDGDLIAIAHPLMQQALLDELSAAMRRALHLEIVEAIAATPLAEVAAARSQGYHLAQAGKPNEAVAHYLRAAEASEIQGQLHEAAADYARALDAEPRIENRVELLKKCAYAAMHVGSDRTEEYWQELGRICAARHDNETYAYALFQQYWTSCDGNAVDRLERAAALGSDTYGWSARAAATLRTLEADYAGGIEHDRRALELARASGDAMLETLALEKLGLAYLYLGDIEHAIESLQDAVHRAVANRYHGWAISAWMTLADCLADDLQTERSLVECRAALKYVDDLGLNRYRSWVRALEALALIRCGKLEEAVAIFEATEAEPGDALDSATVAGVRANLLVEIGDNSSATIATERAMELVMSQGLSTFIFEVQLDRARNRALGGDIDGALEIAATLQLSEPVAMSRLALWLARTALRYGHAGCAELAARVRSGLEGAVPLSALMLNEVDLCLGAIADTGMETAGFEALAARWREVGRPLDEIRSLAGLGMLHVAGGRQAEALVVFKQARDLAASVGATADADFLAGEMRKLGTRSRAKSRSTKVGNLTKRELQIARLVASGLRNAEVASQLFLAEKTVAAHLSNIYGKVSVNSRVQLASWLAENDPEMSSAAAAG